ncbi:MAG: hypothetical protein NVSMB25_07680 [Thermoleophilaceae bacterium]
MNERPKSIRPADERISDEVGERVRSVLSAAESAASAIRHEAEEEAQIHRRAVESECARYLEDARRQAEELLSERIKRISAVSDALLEGADSLLMRLSKASDAKESFLRMVDALAQAADELAGLRAALVDKSSSPSDAGAPATRDREPPPQGAEGRLGAGDRSRTVESGAEDEEARALKPALGAGDPHPDSGSRTTGPEPLHVLASDAGDEMLGARLVALQMAVAGGSRAEVEAHLIRAFELQAPGEILDDVFGAGTNGSKRVAWPEASDASI